MTTIDNSLKKAVEEVFEDDLETAERLLSLIEDMDEDQLSNEDTESRIQDILDFLRTD